LSATRRLRSQRRERRAARVWGAEETGNLVKGLTRCVVNRAAEALHGPIALDPHEQRVPTRDHKANRRECWCLNLCRLAEPGGTEVTLKVIHIKHREAARPRPSAPDAGTDEERSDEARSGRQRYPLDLSGNSEPLGLLQHLAQKARQPLMVSTRRHLWDHAAERCVDRRLARHTFREYLTTAAHEGDRTLVAARFNRQEQSLTHGQSAP
jgi:hypothetical protein